MTGWQMVKCPKGHSFRHLVLSARQRMQCPQCMSEDPTARVDEVWPTPSFSLADTSPSIDLGSSCDSSSSSGSSDFSSGGGGDFGGGGSSGDW